MGHEATNLNVYIADISNGLENVKISFINEINHHKIPKDIIYISNNILSSDTLTEDFESIPLPCKCEVSCNSACSCALGTKIAYSNGILSEDFVENNSKPIVECSDLCTCESSCSNRVVQKGTKLSFQVFMTKNKGFGVRTLEFIPKFAFVCEYAGELIDKPEAEERIRNRSAKEPNYIFILKEHYGNNSHISTIIDPTYFGNVGRYLNHSCSPNLIPVPVRVDSMLPRIAFFAERDIVCYEELTYNYGVDACVEDVNTEKQTEVIQSFKRCHCQSPICSGVLPFDAKSLS